jgi:hypothetical protein
MKLPAASCGVSLERNCAEAPPAFALTSYGAVASPFLSAASCRISWRRRMKKKWSVGVMERWSTGTRRDKEPEADRAIRWICRAVALIVLFY